MNQQNLMPMWLKIVAAVAVVWNLLGVMAYLAEAYRTDAQFAALSQVEQELYASRPSWAVAAFAIAVFAGTIGSILLFLKNSSATAVLSVSLLAVIAQNVYSFGIAKVQNIYSNDVLVMPVMIIVVAIALVLVSRSAQQKGWLG